MEGRAEYFDKGVKHLTWNVHGSNPVRESTVLTEASAVLFTLQKMSGQLCLHFTPLLIHNFEPFCSIIFEYKYYQQLMQYHAE
jgi:hypothetical protein